MYLLLWGASQMRHCSKLTTHSRGDVGSEWAWQLADLGSNPSPTNDELCDFQASFYSFQAPISSVKWGY